MPLAEDILRYALVARATYGDGTPCMAQVSTLGLELESEISIDGLYACAAGDADELLLAFQGTRDLSQLLYDANAFPAPFTSKRLAQPELVHAGGRDAWLMLSEWARGVPVSGRRLKLIGHSLGGLIATDAACDLPADGVWTYGSPRAGDAGFVAAYDALVPDTWRIVHADDLVPTLPLNLPLARYRHVHGGLALSDDGQIGPIPAPTLRGDLDQAAADLDGVALSNHHIENYVWAARAACKAQQPIGQPS